MTDLTIFRDFLVLCQTKSFSRAAERRHVSVSGLSRRIQGLEEWVGTPLFERGKGGLTLTEAGRDLQEVVLDTLHRLDGLRESVAESVNDRQQRIRFCSPHILSRIFFPRWIPRLQDQFTGARLSIGSNTLPECLTALNNREADYTVALLDEKNVVAERLSLVGEGNKYSLIELDTECLVPVSAPNAAGQPIFNLHVASDSPTSFLEYQEECHLGWGLRTSLENRGLNLQRHHDASLAESLHLMTLSGLGVTWLPQSLVWEDLEAKRLVRAGDSSFDIFLKVSLIRRFTPLTFEAQCLWDYLSTLTPGSVGGSCKL
nr:LysR family transcriptional regulator [Halomonas socia]